MNIVKTNVGRRRLMPVREVAAAFQVTPASIRRWAGLGAIPSFRTPGGQLRFYADEIEPLVSQLDAPDMPAWFQPLAAAGRGDLARHLDYVVREHVPAGGSDRCRVCNEWPCWPYVEALHGLLDWYCNDAPSAAV